MKRLIFGLISISAMAAIACSSSSTAGTSADGGPTTNGGDPCSVYANAQIAFEEKCSADIDPNHASAYAARYTTLCDATVALPGIASTFTSTLTACAAALATADCNTEVNQIAACTGIPNGTVATGGTCGNDLQCTSGGCSTDVAQADGGTASCGTCLAPIADGGDCSAGGACITGDTCSFSLDSSGNVAGVCTKQQAPAALGGACTTTDDCIGPNHCLVPAAGGAGACTAPAAAGASCTASSDCVSGLVCTGSDTQVCTTAVAAGGACTSGADCAVGFGCDPTSSKCSKLTFAAQGATCDGAVVLCSQGQCDVPSSGTSDDGGAAPTTGTCPRVIADGQACDESDQAATCDDFANCVNGSCVLLPTTCN